MNTIRNVGAGLLLVLFVLFSNGLAQARTVTLNPGDSPCKVTNCAEAVASDWVRLGEHYNAKLDNWTLMPPGDYEVSPMTKNASVTPVTTAAPKTPLTKKSVSIKDFGNKKPNKELASLTGEEIPFGEGCLMEIRLRQTSYTDVKACATQKVEEAKHAAEQTKSEEAARLALEAELRSRKKVMADAAVMIKRVLWISPLVMLLGLVCLRLLIYDIPDKLERRGTLEAYGNFQQEARVISHQELKREQDRHPEEDEAIAIERTTSVILNQFFPGINEKRPILVSSRQAPKPRRILHPEEKLLEDVSFELCYGGRRNLGFSGIYLDRKQVVVECSSDKKAESLRSAIKELLPGLRVSKPYKFGDGFRLTVKPAKAAQTEIRRGISLAV